MKSRLLSIILYLCVGIVSSAQETEKNRSIYEEAADNYAIGRLEQAQKLLDDNIKNFHGNMLESAYRLLALCCLGLDKQNEAEGYTRQLLNANPYYSTTVSDPQRFIDMVEIIKSGLSATITTASSQAENLNEVPVPTTLITEEMIRTCGGRNLQEVLAAFVPGINIVDCNDDINLSMRGIYSNGQEKILIMLNGHRLNSFCTNIASPDFSMSLEKIKQIEVLRGPASSLYGGVALTAVVNVITKQGADLNGIKLRAGGGSYGTLRGDALFGKRYFDLDIFIWASLYKSNGQKYYVDNPTVNLENIDYSAREILSKIILEKKSGEITVGGVGNKPSYDVGINMKWKDLQMMYCTRFSQIISPYTMSYLYAPYDLKRYTTFNGISPSFATQSHHANISYGHQLGKLYLQGQITYDNTDLTHYQVISDTKVPALGALLALPDGVSYVMAQNEGLYRYINGQEQTIGARVSGDYNYINTSSHKGHLSFGVEMNHFSLEDCRYVLGYNFTKRIEENNNISDIAKGSENTYNSFIQLKHQWNSFILNAGLRYDYKNRYDTRKIDEYSPRIALIYVRPKWNLKLSYSKAFIDAPYLYRKTNEYLTQLTDVAREVLTPESFHSLQLTFGGTEWLRGFNFEVNGFYNRARNLIYMQLIDHKNTGNTDTYGVEFTGSYNSKKISANLNMTWQKLSKSKIFNYEVEKSFNIPAMTANLVVGWRPIKNLKLHSHLVYTSSQTSYSIDLPNVYAQSLIKSTPDHLKDMVREALEGVLMRENGQAINFNNVSSRLLVNLGAQYNIIKNLELSINVRNLFNRKYFQSGMATGEIQQQGRWIIADISYKF